MMMNATRCAKPCGNVSVAVVDAEDPGRVVPLLEAVVDVAVEVVEVADVAAAREVEVVAAVAVVVRTSLLRSSETSARKPSTNSWKVLVKAGWKSPRNR